MIAIIGSNDLETPDDINLAVLPNGRVLISKNADENERVGLENVLDNYRKDAKQAGDETISTADILEMFAHRSNNGYADTYNVWLFDDDGGFYESVAKARELIKSAGLK